MKMRRTRRLSRRWYALIQVRRDPCWWEEDKVGWSIFQSDIYGFRVWWSLVWLRLSRSIRRRIQLTWTRKRWALRGASFWCLLWKCGVMETRFLLQLKFLVVMNWLVWWHVWFLHYLLYLQPKLWVQSLIDRLEPTTLIFGGSSWSVLWPWFAYQFLCFYGCIQVDTMVPQMMFLSLRKRKMKGQWEVTLTPHHVLRINEFFILHVLQRCAMWASCHSIMNMTFIDDSEVVRFQQMHCMRHCISCSWWLKHWFRTKLQRCWNLQTRQYRYQSNSCCDSTVERLQEVRFTVYYTKHSGYLHRLGRDLSDIERRLGIPQPEPNEEPDAEAGSDEEEMMIVEEPHDGEIRYRISKLRIWIVRSFRPQSVDGAQPLESIVLR